MRHFLYVPFTGLGLYNGFRGNRWLKNRIKIFKQFVVPSLEAQTNQNFTIWVSWRREERGNKQVLLLHEYLLNRFDKVVFTYSGVCFWDDKYEEVEAHDRLMMSLHSTAQELVNHVGDVDDVLMTIQPSDDCYRADMVDTMQRIFKHSDYDGAGYQEGYMMNYQTLDVVTYNPETNPPFFTIRFKKEDFLDPFKHMEHTGPYKSHEYIVDCMKYKRIYKRGFLVGTHGENISTVFDHPYAGESRGIFMKLNFGLKEVEPLKIKYSLRKTIMRKLPYGWQRKLRYLFGERLFARFYKFIRS